MIRWRHLTDEARLGQRVFLSIDYSDDDPLVIGGSYKPIGHAQNLEWMLDNGHRVREDWITAWSPVPEACASREDARYTFPDSAIIHYVVNAANDPFAPQPAEVA